MNVEVEIPDPETPAESAESESSEAEAFAGLSEVHSDVAESHAEDSEESAEEAESAAIVALAATAEAEDSAAAAALAATAVTISNEDLRDCIETLPGRIQEAIMDALGGGPEVEVDPMTGDVAPVMEDDEAPAIRQRFHHRLLGSSGGVFRGKR